MSCRTAPGACPTGEGCRRRPLPARARQRRTHMRSPSRGHPGWCGAGITPRPSRRHAAAPPRASPGGERRPSRLTAAAMLRGHRQCLEHGAVSRPVRERIAGVQGDIGRTRPECGDDRLVARHRLDARKRLRSPIHRRNAGETSEPSVVCLSLGWAAGRQGSESDARRIGTMFCMKRNASTTSAMRYSADRPIRLPGTNTRETSDERLFAPIILEQRCGYSEHEVATAPMNSSSPANRRPCFS